MIPIEVILQAREVVKDVSAAFRDMLMNASWIDSVTLKEALHKLKEMRHLVAFPPHALIDALLEEYHEGVRKKKEEKDLHSFTAVM